MCCALAIAGWARVAGPGAADRKAAAATEPTAATRDATTSRPVAVDATGVPSPAADPAASCAATRDGNEPGAIEEIAVAGDLPVYAVRGARPGPPAVFLTGSCSTPLPSVRAFRRAAAAHSGIVALQGDTPCRDGTRRWSFDASATSARIEAALRAAGAEPSREITLVGYSQGAERAEWLAHRFPDSYTRLALMAGPIVPSAWRLERARAVVTLAGYGDVRETMVDGARRLRRGSIPAIYMELPGGTQHGELADEAGETLGRAFDWLEQNARDPVPAVTAPPAHTRARPRDVQARGRRAHPPVGDHARARGTPGS
jgi:pimeloyl-ACP methyl ester carboxylesterase